jgi:hypothetical protein
MMLCFLSDPATAEQSVASKIRNMTGARTKIAWIRASGGKGHPFGPGMNEEQNIWRIVVIDTDHNGGRERYLTEKPADYNHIEITPNGKRVLWACSDGIWISDWDGGNQRKLLDSGLTVGVSEDPDTTEWVYVMDTAVPDNLKPVYRYPINDVTRKELVWNKTASNDKWEISRDGTWGVSGLPWPKAGRAKLPNGEFSIFGEGCTPGGDGTQLFHMKAQGHSGIYIYNNDGSNQRYIDFATQAPGVKKVPLPQFWWCNFARYY